MKSVQEAQREDDNRCPNTLVTAHGRLGRAQAPSGFRTGNDPFSFDDSDENYMQNESDNAESINKYLPPPRSRTPPRRPETASSSHPTYAAMPGTPQEDRMESRGLLLEAYKRSGLQTDPMQSMAPATTSFTSIVASARLSEIQWDTRTPHFENRLVFQKDSQNGWV